jgi:hypothetical protein
VSLADLLASNELPSADSNSTSNTNTTSGTANVLATRLVISRDNSAGIITKERSVSFTVRRKPSKPYEKHSNSEPQTLNP